jgi:hypothetical protein
MQGMTCGAMCKSKLALAVPLLKRRYSQLAQTWKVWVWGSVQVSPYDGLWRRFLRRVENPCVQRI